MIGFVPQNPTMTSTRRADRSARFLSGLLLTAGAAHFLRPEPFDSIVPPALPGSAQLWTRASGVAELVCGAAVAHPRTRILGARASAALFAAVLPANVYMCADHWHDHVLVRALLMARIPLQIPLVQWALRVATGAQQR